MSHPKHFTRAVIREAECIGCTICIQACPVDAIVGAAKQMHTVIESECIGCERCVAPCPVDCIEMVPAPNILLEATHVRQRYRARQRRLAQEKTLRLQQKVKKERKAYVLAAIKRTSEKKRV